MPIAREILSMFELPRKPSQVVLVVVLSRSEIAKIAKGIKGCTHRATEALRL